MCIILKLHLIKTKSLKSLNKTKSSCYTKYGLGGFLLMGLWYPFVRPTSCECSTPLGFPHHLIHLPRTRTHVHVVCKQFQWMPCLPPPCLTLGIHAKSMFENWDFVEFWTCINYDLGIQPMFIRKMHLHYPLSSSNNYY